jgi:hypothetical protein
MPPRIVDENPPHNLGGDRKKVSAVLPADSPCVHKAKIRFIHEGGGLDGPLRVLSSHLPMSQSPEFLVHQRSKPIQSRLVALTPGSKKRAYLRKLLFVQAIV